MDEKILECFKRQITSELGGFLPKGCFKLEAGLNVNGKELSWNEKWECMAAYLGGKLCYESDCNIIALTPRQYAAAQVMEALGNLTDENRHEFNLALKEYFEFLTDTEARPFKPLLEQPKSTTQAAALETSNDDIPGKHPQIAIGMLAIKAAWEIERTTGKRATSNEVIQKLQEWESNNPILLEKLPHGVVWATTNGKEKPYDINTCAKTLET